MEAGLVVGDQVILIRQYVLARILEREGMLSGGRTTRSSCRVVGLISAAYIAILELPLEKPRRSANYEVPLVLQRTLLQ